MDYSDTKSGDNTPPRTGKSGTQKRKELSDEQKEKYAQDVRERYGKAIRAIRPQLTDYWLNFAFIGGYQWLYNNPAHRTIEELPRLDDRVRATVNRLWPDSRIIISKLTQRDMEFEVLPNGADDASIRGAALGESILDDIRTRHGWEALRTNNAWGTWKGGTAAICVDWDPKAGSPVSTPDAREGGTGKAIFTGDTVETALSLAEFAVEPGVRDPERARWWIKALALPPEDVQYTYGLEETPEADATNGQSEFQRKLIADAYSEGEQVDLTLVLTYYERPNPGCPDGKICTVVGNSLVFEGPWPFPWKDRLNLAVTYETEVESRWTGDSVVTMARPIQVLYNAAWSNITEHMKQAGNARLAMPYSSIDLVDGLTDTPAEVVPYADGMAPPSWLSPPVMPNWWIEQPERLRAELDDLLGVHDVSRGRAPVNIESGYGLSILSEQDNTPVGKMIKSAATAWSTVASMVLELYGHNVKSKRRAVVSAPGMPAETTDWTGQDLMGQYRAFLPEDNVMPRSNAAQFEAAKEMVQMGLIQDIETFSAVSELPGRRQMIERMKPDVAKARRENGLMASDKVCVPAVFDDHGQHIAEHNVFRKSARWDRLSEKIQQTINDHIEAHERLAAEATARAHQQAAVDPALATIPHGDSRPTLSPEEVAAMAPAPGATASVPAPNGPEPLPGELPPGQEIPPELLMNPDIMAILTGEGAPAL